MKTWNQLFIRHGWRIESVGENKFDISSETKENLEFLYECLGRAGVEFTMKNDQLILHNAPISEQSLIGAVDFPNRGRGEGLWFQPGKEEPKVQELDTFISGIVRQLNRLGFYTMGSCDGHERRAAYVMLSKAGRDVNELRHLLTAIGIKRVHFQEHQNYSSVSLHFDRNELLNLAEKLSIVEESWLNKGETEIKQHYFNHTLDQLLSIPGVSGNEEKVRAFVKQQLTPLVDFITIDRHGNLLAEKTYRSGHGPTILLNAHLDIAQELTPGRTIIKENGIWSSSNGILGADDRAGVAILLHMAEHLQNSSFSGRVRFLFTVKEEIGLVGARQLDEYFLWGTDAAVVVDWRGMGDIVTSCGGYIPFCEESYGEFFEKIAVESGLEGWKCTPGGSSDTRVWAEHGIQSVNLSVGYQHEHTDYECLDVAACFRTTLLVKALFEKGAELRRLLNRIHRGSKDKMNITGGM